MSGFHGVTKTCDSSATFGDTLCPLPTIYAVKPSERQNLFYKFTADASLSAWDASNWNLFTGTITVQSPMANYEYVWIYIPVQNPGNDLYVDELSITKVA